MPSDDALETHHGSSTEEEQNHAVCQACGVVLKGSREPGEKDWCVEVGREVTLAKPNRNKNACQITPVEGGLKCDTDAEDIHSAIEAHRNGERVPVDIHPNDRLHGVVP